MSTGKPKRHQKLVDKHILIVEDYDLIGKVLVDLLKHYDHASHVRSGNAALREIERNPPDIILLDLILPDMSGLELARMVRQNTKTKSTPILAMSASAGEKANCLKAGCNGFILKPFHIPELLNELTALLP